MVVARGIPFVSVCEHYMMPFTRARGHRAGWCDGSERTVARRRRPARRLGVGPDRLRQ
ncbi:MAG: GTP cyclohydrolase I [Actinomycetota bacterium]|nr:GTP cyclohydrolase I [Actinomycetota bacterium]